MTQSSIAKGKRQLCFCWPMFQRFVQIIRFQLIGGTKFSPMSFCSLWVFLQILKTRHVHESQPKEVTQSPWQIFIISYCHVPQQFVLTGVSCCFWIYLDWNNKIRFLNAFCFHVHYIINQFHFVLDVIPLQNTEKTLNKWNCVCPVAKIWVILKVFSWNISISARKVFQTFFPNKFWLLR